jgi:hypothetical protein
MEEESVAEQKANGERYSLLEINDTRLREFYLTFLKGVKSTPDKPHLRLVFNSLFTSIRNYPPPPLPDLLKRTDYLVDLVKIYDSVSKIYSDVFAKGYADEITFGEILDKYNVDSADKLKSILEDKEAIKKIFDKNGIDDPSDLEEMLDDIYVSEEELEQTLRKV